MSDTIRKIHGYDDSVISVESDAPNSVKLTVHWQNVSISCKLGRPAATRLATVIEHTARQAEAVTGGGRG